MALFNREKVRVSTEDVTAQNFLAVKRADVIDRSRLLDNLRLASAVGSDATTIRNGCYYDVPLQPPNSLPIAERRWFSSTWMKVQLPFRDHKLILNRINKAQETDNQLGCGHGAQSDHKQSAFSWIVEAPPMT